MLPSPFLRDRFSKASIFLLNLKRYFSPKRPRYSFLISSSLTFAFVFKKTAAVNEPKTVGVPFGYMIAASGLPTNYTATPLPAGLVCNATTGVITGTPSVAGFTLALLAARNATGTGNATLAITIAAAPLPPSVTTQPRSQRRGTFCATSSLWYRQ